VRVAADFPLVRGTNVTNVATPRWIFFALFVVSGFSGLIYESIWSHYLKLFLGHAAYAQSLVLAIFMGGMAGGAWLASRISARLRTPLLIYAAVEGVVGLLALAFHGTFQWVTDAVFGSLLPGLANPQWGSALQWSVATILILPQAVLLGMTFPLMSAGVIRQHPRDSGSTLAMLYFTNSAGAAIGILASGFWLIGLVGLPGTMRIAGLLNLALALLIGMLAYRENALPAAARSERSLASSPTATRFLVAAFVTGCASFIYEIGWIRMLSLVLGSTTHSFELMLSAFITGLACGGLWIRRRIDSIEDPTTYAGVAQIAMGIAAILTIPIYAQSFGWMEWVLSALTRSDEGFALFTIASHGIALAVMLPTTFLAGMTLPLFTIVMLRAGNGERAIGRVYAANTLGAIVGVVFAVHIGLPQLGLRHLIGFGAVLDVVLGVALLAWAGRSLSIGTLAASAAIGCGAIGVVLSTVELPTWQLISSIYRSGDLDVMRDAEVLFYRDGKTATISLARFANDRLVIATNGKPDAAINMRADGPPSPDEVTMVLAGSLPLAYKPDARRIANIGFGSGLTAHTLLADPAITIVDTIEIEPMMVLAARGFGAHVARAYQDPRSRIHSADARTFFALHNLSYDIIVAEPSNPWVSGVSSLFSKEFYGSIANYLSDDGLLVQWLQLYEFDDELVSSVLGALATHFEDFVVYHADDVNILILARRGGNLGSPDLARLLVGDMATSLARVGIGSVQELERRYVGDRRSIQALLQPFEAPANSDFYPYLDLHAGKARFIGATAVALPSYQR